MKRQNWEDFLRLSGTEYKIENYTEKDYAYEYINGEKVQVYSRIFIREGMKKVTGYNWFYITISFDANENYLGIGAWE
jgi:hypothetical protein